MRKLMNNGCDRCRYCSEGPWDAPDTVYYCINENSDRFGTIVCSQIKGVSTKCSLYKETACEKVLAMPLNEALKTLLYENAETFFNTHANFGMEGASRPCAVKLFATNEELLAWKDAYMRWLEAYKANGTFVQEGDERMKFQYINGYGLDCTDAVVRPEKQRAFFNDHVKDCPDMWQEFLNYCRDTDNFDENAILTNDEDKDSIDPELISGFFDSYENLLTGASGFGAVLVDTINACEFAGREVFEVCDGYIYVAAYVPENGNESRLHPTRKDVRDTLARYVTPYTENKKEAEWLSICLSGPRCI